MMYVNVAGLKSRRVTFFGTSKAWLGTYYGFKIGKREGKDWYM